MKKSLLVLRHEIITIVTRPSYLFALFGIPIIAAVIFTIAGKFSGGFSAPKLFTQLVTGSQSVNTEGYVDSSGIIKQVPASVPTSALIAFPNEAAAQQALDEKKISAYYLISPDYLKTGEITSISSDFTPLKSSRQSGLIEWIINVNLLGGDELLASRINGPTNIQKEPLSAAPQREEGNMLTFFLPYAVTMIYYFIILSSASLMLSSVAKEKENRVMEVLMVTITPRQLLTGKIIGLGVIGLVQTIVWVGTGRLLLSRGASIFNLSAAFQLPTSFLVWGLVFFILGYAVYASLMAGLGSLVPNMREASQATIMVIFPLIIPIFLINVLIEEPHSLLATILSLFPFTSPVAMMTRLASGGVPTWQLALAAVLLLGTAILVVRVVARMFQAQSILSGQPFTRKLFLNALLGKTSTPSLV